MMDIAFTVARRGTCSRLQVGAIVSRDGRVISTGYNGKPVGMSHCVHTDDEPCRLAVHAEANAVAFAARYGVSCAGAELHVTHQPCLNCAMLVINAGIVRVSYLETYRDPAGLHLLEGAGIDVNRMGSR